MSELKILTRRVDLPDSVKIDTYLANDGYAALTKVLKEMTPAEKLRFRLNRYLMYYLPYVEEKSKSGCDLRELLEEATDCLERYTPEAEAIVEEVILAIKQRGIP